MSDSEGNQDFTSTASSGPWKPVRTVVLAAGLLLLIAGTAWVPRDSCC